MLLLHGVGASRQATAANAEWLASLGYATLAIDFRGHGGSSSEPRTFGFDEALDAHAAFAWLKRRQGDAPVAIIGISLGGAASLLGDDGPIHADALDPASGVSRYPARHQEPDCEPNDGIRW